MFSSTPYPEPFSTEVFDLHVGLYSQLAPFVMLIYDHILTFPEEVERIWQQKVSGVTLLFLLNRYLTPIQYIITIDAFHDPIWTKTACDYFVLFEGASMVTLVGIGELIMILRVYALYGRSTPILIFLLVLWTVQIAISAFSLHSGHALPMPPPLVGCFLAVRSHALLAFWITPLITDTCIFALTLYRTRNYIRNTGKTPTIHMFLRDGALYFFLIFKANLINTLVFFLAPSALKGVGALFCQQVTATMISRVLLNLRSLSTEGQNDSFSGHHGPREASLRFVTQTIDNLGEDLDVSYQPETTEAPDEQPEDMPIMKSGSSNATPV